MDILKYLIELIGTFLFVYVVLNVTNSDPKREPLLGASAIAVTLLVMVLIGNSIGSGNFNPALSVAKFMDGSLDVTHMTGFIVCQLIGAFLAFNMWKMTKK